jgi:hypothetical protein
METIAPEHCFWNGQAPVSGVSGGDLVTVRFLEQNHNQEGDCLHATPGEDLWESEVSTVFDLSGRIVTTLLVRQIISWRLS